MQAAGTVEEVAHEIETSSCHGVGGALAGMPRVVQGLLASACRASAAETELCELRARLASAEAELATLRSQRCVIL